MHPSLSLLVFSSFDDTAVRRACLRGDLVRVCSGRYVRAEHWAGFSLSDRHAMKALACLTLLHDDSAVIAGLSAAPFWGLPTIGGWPDRVRVIDERLDGATATSHLVKCPGVFSEGDVVDREGVFITSALRTAVDIALTTPLRRSVVALDHGLRVGLFTKEELRLALDRRSEARARRRAARAIEFADARAHGPGESLSRVVMWEGRLPRPILQKKFVGPRGQTADTDFFFEDAKAVGEFDGEVKYTDERMRAGRTPSQVVVDEKNRENWLRAEPGVDALVRWVWREALEPGRLVSLLLAAGVRPLRVPFDVKSGD